MLHRTFNFMGGLILFSLFIFLSYVASLVLGWAWDKEIQFQESIVQPYRDGAKALLEDDARKDMKDTDLTDNHCY